MGETSAEASTAFIAAAVRSIVASASVPGVFQLLTACIRQMTHNQQQHAGCHNTPGRERTRTVFLPHTIAGKIPRSGTIPEDNVGASRGWAATHSPPFVCSAFRQAASSPDCLAPQIRVEEKWAFL